jgi:ElaB/YqjD/DUF883 family membrane-anchored ribosome-binding protein
MTEQKIHEKVEVLERELSKLRGELGRLVEVARETATESTQVRDDNSGEGEEGAETPRDHLEREAQAAAEAGKRLLHKLDEVAERQPIGSLVVAFAVGLIAARILGMGRER